MREVRGEGQNGGREEVCDLIKTGTLGQKREEERRKRQEREKDNKSNVFKVSY